MKNKKLKHRTSILNRNYIDTTYLNKSISNIQYIQDKTNINNDFDIALIKMDNLLSSLFEKYKEKLK